MKKCPFHICLLLVVIGALLAVLIVALAWDSLHQAWENERYLSLKDTTPMQLPSGVGSLSDDITKTVNGAFQAGVVTGYNLRDKGGSRGDITNVVNAFNANNDLR